MLLELFWFAIKECNLKDPGFWRGYAVRGLTVIIVDSVLLI